MSENGSNHYAILNLPTNADFVGVENAYARLSNELASQTWFDETATAQLMRVNQAYAVLSRPDLRTDYDKEFFSREIKEKERLERRLLRHHRQKQLAATLAALAVLSGEVWLVSMALFGTAPFG